MSGDAEGDIISNISNIIGSPYSDILTGDFHSNSIQGGDGNDFICGMGGNDTLLDGGSGNDTITYEYCTVGV